MAAAEHPPDDLRVEGTATPGDAGDRVDEALDITHALLEEIADSFRALADQVERVLLLVILREHEHTCLWPLASQLDRRPQTIISMPGRHVHISDHDRRTVRETPAQQIVGVAGLSDDLEPGLGKQPRDPLAQQHIVLADHHSQRL